VLAIAFQDRRVPQLQAAIQRRFEHEFKACTFDQPLSALRCDVHLRHAGGRGGMLVRSLSVGIRGAFRGLC